MKKKRRKKTNIKIGTEHEKDRKERKREKI